MRRNLRETPTGGLWRKQGKPAEKPMPPIPEEAPGFEEFNSIECARALVAVEDKLHMLARSVDDETCASYLRDGHFFKCLRIKKD